MGRREILKRAKQDPQFRQRMIVRLKSATVPVNSSNEELTGTQKWTAKFLANRFGVPLSQFEFFNTKPGGVVTAKFKAPRGWAFEGQDFSHLKDTVTSFECIGNNVFLVDIGG